MIRFAFIVASLAKFPAIGAALLGAAWIGGCASGGETGAGAVTGRLQTLGPSDAAPIEAAQLRSDAPQTCVFARIEGDEQARLEIERDAPGEGGRYLQRRWSVTGGERTLLREQHLIARDDGAVLLQEEVNHAEKVEVVFTPALMVVPARLAPGPAEPQKVRMVVHPLGDRSRTRARGTVEQSMTIGAPVRVRTPAGEFDAWPLSSTFKADLGPSKVTNESELWLAAGIGIIAERRRERTTALGIPIRDNREGWVLAEAPR